MNIALALARVPFPGWLRHSGLALLLAALGASVAHAQWVVVDARGGGVKIGQSLAASAPLTLKEGERLVLVSADGRSLTLRGPHSGPPTRESGARSDPAQALAVLLTSRDARTKSVGVVRAGTDAVKTPDPWAIDISRGGPRCLREGERPELWRPEPLAAQAFVVFPADRSWRADLAWAPGQDRLQLPDLSRFQRPTTWLVNIDQKEHALTFSRIPAEITDPFVLAAWMLEKGCIQQGDALLRLLSVQLGLNPAAAR